MKLRLREVKQTPQGIQVVSAGTRTWPRTVWAHSPCSLPIMSYCPTKYKHYKEFISSFFVCLLLLLFWPSHVSGLYCLRPAHSFLAFICTLIYACGCGYSCLRERHDQRSDNNYEFLKFQFLWDIFSSWVIYSYTNTLKCLILQSKLPYFQREKYICRYSAYKNT